MNHSRMIRRYCISLYLPYNFTLSDLIHEVRLCEAARNEYFEAGQPF